MAVSLAEGVGTGQRPTLLGVVQEALLRARASSCPVQHLPSLVACVRMWTAGENLSPGHALRVVSRRQF